MPTQTEVPCVEPFATATTVRLPAFLAAWCATSLLSGLMGQKAEGNWMVADSGRFEEFVTTARPRLLRALIGARGEEAGDATAEALAYAWEHWSEVALMDNPIGFLYRVGQSRTRPRRTPRLPPPASMGLPEVEPGLVQALLRLPESQRTAVWLVHACQWQYAEVAEALQTTTSMVGNHVTRGLQRLRRELEVEARA